MRAQTSHCLLRSIGKGSIGLALKGMVSRLSKRPILSHLYRPTKMTMSCLFSQDASIGLPKSVWSLLGRCKRNLQRRQNPQESYISLFTCSDALVVSVPSTRNNSLYSLSGVLDALERSGVGSVPLFGGGGQSCQYGSLHRYCDHW